MGKVRKALRGELEAGADERGFGKGWISGVLALALGVGGLAAVLFLKFPGMLSMPMLRDYYGMGEVRLALHVVLIGAFVLALSNLVLRRRRTMGLVAVTAVLVATLLGGSRVESEAGYDTGYYLGLDWFLINLTLLGMLFIPLERIFGRLTEQPVFRFEWREDLLYFLINSLLVQSLTFLSLAPATAVVTHTAWTDLRAFMASQPIWLQVIEIMVLTDLTQYWVHRVFHRLPFLWKFHAVHHSAQAMDWLAGSRMHLVEVVALRGLTVIPMMRWAMPTSR